MATEKRLIDVNSLDELEELDYDYAPVRDGCAWYRAADVWACIESLPTVDAIEIPCKIGDRVWCIRNYKGHKHPQDGIVSEMFFGEDMRLHIVVKHIARGEWGKEIFATREDAVAAIVGERKDNARKTD